MLKLIPSQLQAVVSKMENKQYNVNPASKFILQLGMLLMGEYPIRTVPVRGVLFEGYEDPLVTVLNSPLLKFLDDTFNGGQSILPFPVPALRKMGYFVDVRILFYPLQYLLMLALACSIIIPQMKITGLTREKAIPTNMAKLKSGPTCRHCRGGIMTHMQVQYADQVQFLLIDVNNSFNMFRCKSKSTFLEDQR
jgi:hypothetical protein